MERNRDLGQRDLDRSRGTRHRGVYWDRDLGHRGIERSRGSGTGG
jgi:hypothetical protein